jgi:hypothetical protein
MKIGDFFIHTTFDGRTTDLAGLCNATEAETKHSQCQNKNFRHGLIVLSFNS